MTLPDSTSDPETQLKLLRAQVARLTTENLALQQQVDQLTRQKAEVSVQAIAQAALRTVVAAEQAMAREASDGRRYAIPELDASLRGVVVARDGAIALRVPSPEQPVPGDMLGTVRVAVAQVPTVIESAPADAVAPTAAAAGALERAQATFASWSGRGAAAAGDVVAAVTRLLGAGPAWEPSDLRAGLDAMIDAATALTQSASGGVSQAAIDASLAAGRELRVMVRSSEPGKPLSKADFDRFAASIDRFVGAYAALTPK